MSVASRKVKVSQLAAHNLPLRVVLANNMTALFNCCDLSDISEQQQRMFSDAVASDRFGVQFQMGDNDKWKGLFCTVILALSYFRWVYSRP